MLAWPPVFFFLRAVNLEMDMGGGEGSLLRSVSFPSSDDSVSGSEESASYQRLTVVDKMMAPSLL